MKKKQEIIGGIVGKIARLRCLKTVKTPDPLIGVDFYIIRELPHTYYIISTHYQDMIFEVNKKDITII